jgi:hypothetical protein
MNLRSDFRTARRTSGREWRLLVEAGVLLGVARLAVWFVPFRRLPWMSQCLVQAVAATWMLQRRRIPSTLYFGLAKDSDGKLIAHAWVRSGERILTGAKGHHDYRVVATFAEPDLCTGCVVSQ